MLSSLCIQNLVINPFIPFQIESCICLSKTDLPYAAMRFYLEEHLLEQLGNIKQCCKNKFIKSLDLLLDWDDEPKHCKHYN